MLTQPIQLLEKIVKKLWIKN